MKPIYQKEIPNYCKIKFKKEHFNKRFGHLRVIGISKTTDSTNIHFFMCICDCGKLFHTRKYSILNGRTKSTISNFISGSSWKHLMRVALSEKIKKLKEDQGK